MTKSRMEAFSDGVIAIIITIMVLELHPPDGGELAGLKPLLPTFMSYVLSFLYVGIYWTNHHHMLHAVQRVNGPILWANLHLLFWLSLFPFVTGFAGHNHFSPESALLYGIVLLMASVAYYLLSQLLIRFHGEDSTIGRAFGRDSKGLVSTGIYVFALLVALFHPNIAFFLYAFVAVMWVVPDRRIEKTLEG